MTREVADVETVAEADDARNDATSRGSRNSIVKEVSQGDEINTNVAARKQK